MRGNSLTFLGYFIKNKIMVSKMHITTSQWPNKTDAQFKGKEIPFKKKHTKQQMLAGKGILHALRVKQTKNAPKPAEAILQLEEAYFTQS